MEQNESMLIPELKIDESAILHLRETAKWARFLSIMGFIFSALLGIFAVFINYFFSLIYRMNPVSIPATGTGIISIVYIAIAVVYFLLSLYLYLFASKMLSSLQLNDQGIFNESLLNLKRVYRIMGIITIIYLAFMALALVGVVLLAGFKR